MTTVDPPPGHGDHAGCTKDHCHSAKTRGGRLSLPSSCWLGYLLASG